MAAELHGAVHTNAGWALEWERAIVANGTLTITQDMTVILVP